MLIEKGTFEDVPYCRYLQIESSRYVQTVYVFVIYK